MQSISLKKHRNNKKTFIILSVVILLAVLGSVTYVYAFGGNLFGWQADSSHTQPQEPDPTSNPTDEQVDNGEKLKQEIVEEGQSLNGKPSSSSVGDTAPKPSGSDFSVTLTAINQSESALIIRSLIGAVTNTGTCTLTLTSDGNTVTKTAGTQASANSSTCKGFDVPLAELSKGEWHLSLKVDAGDKSSVVEKDVTVN